MTWLACLLFGRKGENENRKRLLKIGIFGIACWQALTFMSSVLKDNGALRVYQMGNMTTLEVSGGEYLPSDYNLDDYVDELTYDPEKLIVTGWNRDNNRIRVEISNPTGETQQVEVPFLYYKGYTAKDENGSSLSILTSAAVLAIAGTILGQLSTNGVLSQLGTLIGRGAVLSFALVIFVLPPLLMLADGLIRRTTLHADFYGPSDRAGKKKRSRKD